MIDELKARLRKEEGVRFYPYDDSTGKEFKRGMTLKGCLTIGVGFNLSTRPLPENIINQLLDHSILGAINDLKITFSEFDLWTENRKIAMTDVMFAMGLPTFLEFKKMIHAAEIGMWETAANELLDSEWARQVGDRSFQLAKLLKEG